MAVFSKPDQNLTYNIPDIGEVFSLGDPNQLFKRTDSGIFAIEASKVPGIDTASLNKYILGDLRGANSAGAKLFQNSDNPQPIWTTDTSLFQNNQRLGGSYTAPVDTNLQGLIQAGGAGIGGFQAGGTEGVALGQALSTTPEAITNRLRGIQETNPITPSSLGAATPAPFKPAPQPSTPTDIAGLEIPDLAGSLTPQEQQVSDLDKQIAELNNRLLGKSAFTAEQERAAGIPEAQQAMDDLGARLKDIQRQQAAIPIQLQEQAVGRGLTTQLLGRQEQKLLRNNAIEALTVSSLMDAASNRLTSAQRKVDRAVAEKYNPILEEIEVKIANAKLIKDSPEYSAADRKRAALIVEAQTKNKTALEDQKAEQKEIWNMMNEAVAGGLRDTNIMERIRTAKSKEEAMALAAPYIGRQSELERKKLEAETRRINAETQKSLNDVAAKAPGAASELKVSALNSARQLLTKFSEGKGTSAVGRSGFLSSLGFGLIPGTQRADFVTQFNNLKALLSLDNVKYLKGQGQVSDAERRLLEQASGKLALAQSEPEFETALREILTALGGEGSTLKSPDGKQFVNTAELTSEQVAEAKAAGWR